MKHHRLLTRKVSFLYKMDLLMSVGGLLESTDELFELAAARRPPFSSVGGLRVVIVAVEHKIDFENFHNPVRP